MSKYISKHKTKCLNIFLNIRQSVSQLAEASGDFRSEGGARASRVSQLPWPPRGPQYV